MAYASLLALWVSFRHARKSVAVVVCTGAITLFLPQYSHAADILWSSASGSAYLSTSSWTNGIVPTASDNAQFGVNPTGNASVGINFNQTTNAGTQTTGSRIEDVGAVELTSARTTNLTINNSSTTSGATGNYRLVGTTVNGVSNVILRSNGSGNLTLANGSSQPMNVTLANTTANKVVIDSSGNILISSILQSNTGSTTPLTIQGAGVGRFDVTNTANTFTGNIIVNGGEVRFSANGSLGNSVNTVTIDGGRFGIASTASTTVNLSARSIFLGATAGTSISTPGQLSTVLQYDGTLQDKAGSVGILVKQGAGVLSLGGQSNYTGATSINQGNIQLTAGSDRLPTGTTVNIGQASSANVGILDLNSQSQQIAGLNSTAGTNASMTAKNTVTSAAAATLTLGGSGTYVYGDGTVANSGVITGAIAVSKTGGGTQTFGDANTYAGGTTISGGTLSTGSASGTFGTSGVTVAGATLTLGNAASIADTATLVFASANSRINMNAASGMTETLAEIDGNAFVLNTAGVYTADQLNDYFTDGTFGGDNNLSVFASGNGETFTISPAPEPVTAALFVLGGSVLFGSRRGRRHVTN